MVLWWPVQVNSLFFFLTIFASFGQHFEDRFTGVPKLTSSIMIFFDVLFFLSSFFPSLVTFAKIILSLCNTFLYFSLSYFDVFVG